MIRRIFLVVFVFLSMLTSAQKYYGSYVSIDFGGVIGLTDVKRYQFAPTLKTENELQPGFGVEATFFTTDNIGFNIDLHQYYLAGMDLEKNMKFHGSFFSPSINMSFAVNKMFEENLASPWNRRFKMFAKLGIGSLSGTTTLEEMEGYEMEEEIRGDYEFGDVDVNGVCFPLELTFMYKLNPRHSQFFRDPKERLFLVLSASLIYTATDDLDGFEDWDFGDDSFTYFSFGIAYFMGK